MPAVLNHLCAEVTLAEHRVAGNHPTFQHHSTEQLEGRLVLVGLTADFHLAKCQAAPLGHRREQVNGTFVAADAASSGLAVQGDRLNHIAVLRLGGQCGAGGFGPAGQRFLELLRRNGDEQFAESSPFRWRAGEAQGVHQSDVLVVDPLGDRLEAASATQDRATNGSEHRFQ
jgi:hypothetical protein